LKSGLSLAQKQVEDCQLNRPSHSNLLRDVVAKKLLCLLLRGLTEDQDLRLWVQSPNVPAIFQYRIAKKLVIGLGSKFLVPGQFLLLGSAIFGLGLDLENFR